MGNFTKNQHRRELMKANVEHAKQSTLDSLSFQFDISRAKEATKPTKEIVINGISDITKEDELEVRVEFSLMPSKAFFSKANLDLFFQETLLKSASLIIPTSQLLNDSFEFREVLEMKGVAAGEYLVRVEMYEPWSSGEKLNFTAKEVTVHYVPQTRAERFVKIPTVKSVAGADLTVVSSSAKDIYREIEEDLKKESISKRDEW